VAWWWYGVWLWDSMWWCMGLPWQLRTTTLGMAHTSVSVWWKAMKPAAGQSTDWPFLGPPTKTNALFHSINILLYSVLALCESCIHCVTYVIHPPPPIITLFTYPCQVQLMRRGFPSLWATLKETKTREGVRFGECANVIENFGFWTGTVKRLYRERKLSRLSKRAIVLPLSYSW